MEMMNKGIAGMPGKDYLMQRNEVKKCLDCPFFRSCWNSEEYDRLVR
jgi:hypothetical protein